MKLFNIKLPPLPTPPPSHLPDRATQLQIATLVFIAVVVHFTIAVLPVAIYALLVWALKTLTILRRRKNPPKYFVLLLTILSFALILIFYGGWNGQIAGISFLVLLLSLKFLEAITLRDFYMVCVISYFVASLSFLFNASMLNIALVTLYVIYITAVLLQISNPEKSKFISKLPTAGKILLKALPLTILLFFLFPRIQGSFGFLPSNDEISGENTLSNELVSGEFAQSAFNNELAFRVEFEGALPAYRDQYWRAKVMTKEDNFTWSINVEEKRGLAAAKRDRSKLRYAENEMLRYQIVHESSGGAFAPLLDYGLEQTIGVQLHDYSVFKQPPTEGAFSYQGVSTLTPNYTQHAEAQSSHLLLTSQQPSAKVKTLLNRWRQSSSNQQELVNQVFQHFAGNNFRYTLAPPSLGRVPIEDFLFKTQAGYCEHYASAFTILMRWLNIPARVVVGYHGGTYNQLGNFIEVRYSDAHAWSEVWINNRWTRVDPTAAISPDRIDFGMQALMSIWDGSAFDGASRERALSNILNPSGLRFTTQQLKDAWANVGYQWNKWIINYDFKAQQKLLAKMGFEHRNSLMTLMALLMASTLIIMLIYFWQLLPKAQKITDPEKSYRQFLKRLGKLNINKAPSETPNEFARKAMRKHPAQAQEIAGITDQYVQIRYASRGDLIETFKQQVKAFKLRTE